MEHEKIEMTKIGKTTKPKEEPVELFETQDPNRTQFGELSCYFPDPKTGEYRIVISSNYMLYIVITVFMILLNIFFHIHYYNYLNRKVAHYAIGMYVLSLLCSLKVFLCNPGIPNTRSNEVAQLDEEDKEFCDKCHVWLDSRKFFLHCRQCGCCIEDLENHSAFFGKCVGKGNFWSYNIYFVTHLLTLAFMVCVKGYNI